MTSEEVPPTNVTKGPFSLLPGPHNITIIFGKYFGARNSDRVMVREIIIEGVQGGGAGECIPCPEGTASTGQSEDCMVCPPGTYSLGNASSCSPCPENTYQNQPQQPSCKPCGPGTFTPSGSAECSFNNCTFRPPGTGETYDLKGLNRDTLYGPLSDSFHALRYYYVSPCKKILANSSLYHDEDGVPLEGFAFEANPSNSSVSLGTIMGYYYLNTPNQKGLILSYTDGTPGCGDPPTSPDIPRSLNITLICDPTAGIGFPERDQTIYTGLVYPNVCTYKLKWRSIYGCPVCTDDDYVELIEGCQNGISVVHYVLKDEPARCHDGTPPPSKYVNCTVASSCPVGSYLSRSGNCITCKTGLYSSGNGEDITKLTDMELSCTPIGSCNNWTLTNGYFISGANQKGISVMQLTRNFKAQVGNSIKFQLRYSAGQGTKFVFYIDSRVEKEFTRPPTGIAAITVLVPRGTHTLRWEYQHGLKNFSSQRDNEVVVSVIKLKGTKTAVTSCSPCAGGEIVDKDGGSCHQCPKDSPPSSPPTRCIPCDDDHYSFNTYTACVQKPICNPNDFILVYSSPDNNRCEAPLSERTPSRSSYSPLVPCLGDPPVAPTSCTNCPFGTTWNSSSKDCSPCPPGQRFSSGNCIPVSIGYSAVRSDYYFKQGDVEEPQSNIRSTCSGFGCYSPQGWRLLGQYVDSGIHVGDAETNLTIYVTTAESGFQPVVNFTLSLNYAFADQNQAISRSGIEFFIDDLIQPIPFATPIGEVHDYSFPILGTPGRHTLSWVYYQFIGDPPLLAVLKDVVVFSTANGIPTEEIICPAGTHSDSLTGLCSICPPGSYSPAGAAHCIPCPINTISPIRSQSCTPCPEGTVSVNNHCRSTCLFKDSTFRDYPLEYDLTSLKGSIYSVTHHLVGFPSVNYEINLCNQFLSDDCTVESCYEASYVFALYSSSDMDSQPLTLGTELTFKPMPHSSQQSGSHPAHSFDLVYSKGEVLHPSCVAGGVSTTIHFVCNKTVGRGSPTIVSVDDKCHPVFEWASIYACHKCLDIELATSPGSCVDGKRLVSYYYANPCLGDPPAPVTQDCEDINVAKNTALLGVSIVALIVIVGLSLGILFYIQRRSLKAKYKLLKEEANLELDEDDEGKGTVVDSDHEEEQPAVVKLSDGEDDLPVIGSEKDN